MRLVHRSFEWQSGFLDLARDHAAAGEDRYALGLRDFPAYLQRLQASAAGAPRGRGRQISRWLVDSDRLVACVRLRLQLTPDLMDEGGHIGYDVRPSLRGRGYGTALLRLALVEARALGIERVRITCDDDNIASSRVIERNGGVLAGTGTSTKSGKRIRRYWIEP